MTSSAVVTMDIVAMQMPHGESGCKSLSSLVPMGIVTMQGLHGINGLEPSSSVVTMYRVLRFMLTMQRPHGNSG